MVADPWEYSRTSNSENASQGPQARCCWYHETVDSEYAHVVRALSEHLVCHVRPDCEIAADVFIRPTTFTALVKLFKEPQYLTKKDEDEDPDAGITAIDYEEQTAGYQAAYSRLAASETVSVDPVAYVRDPRDFLGQELSKLAQRDPRVKSLISAADPSLVGPFLQSLATLGTRSRM